MGRWTTARRARWAGLGLGALLMAGCGGGARTTVVDFAWRADDSTEVFSPAWPRVQLAETPPRTLTREPAYVGSHRYGLLALGDTLGTPLLVAVELRDAAESPGALGYFDADRDGDLAEEEPRPFAPYEDDPGYYHLDDETLVWSRRGPQGTEEASALFGLVLHWVPGGETASLRLSYRGRLRGEAAVGKGKAALLLYDADVNGIYDRRDLLVIDQNGDGVLDGDRNSVELYALDEPFLLGKEAFEVREIPADGRCLVLGRSRQPVAPRVAVTVGSVAPDFTLRDLSGNAVRLSSFRGRPLLLSFWATW